MELVYRTLKEYLYNFKKNPEETCFVICSNKKVPPFFFKELNIFFANGNLVEDLYTLSKTDLIFGCRSTYSSFASYYGNVPLIIFNQRGIDWRKIVNKSQWGRISTFDLK